MRACAARLGFASGVFVLFGCAASGTPYQKLEAPAGKSVVYVYRPYSFVGSALHPTVTCGEEGVSLSPGGYHPYLVDPGSVTCRASTESTSEVEVKAVSGQPSYVKEEIGVGLVAGRPHLTLMDSMSGESDIAKCKQQN